MPLGPNACGACRAATLPTAQHHSATNVQDALRVGCMPPAWQPSKARSQASICKLGHLVQGVGTPTPLLAPEVEVHAGSTPTAPVGLEASLPCTPHILHA